MMNTPSRQFASTCRRISDSLKAGIVTNSAPSNIAPGIIPALTLCALLLAVAAPPCLGQAPVAPTNLIVTTVSSNQLQLAWTDLSNDETGFIIERKKGVP